MRWRTLAIAIAWVVAAGWGIYYLVALAGSSPAYGAFAIAHFVVGYLLGRAIMTAPLAPLTALLAIGAAGALTILALRSATTEAYFAWAGPLAAIALADRTSARNVAYSVGAFATGLLALIWLAP